MNTKCHLPHPHDKAHPAQLPVTRLTTMQFDYFSFVEHTTIKCKSFFFRILRISFLFYHCQIFNQKEEDCIKADFVSVITYFVVS